jgi:neopullulanase
VDAQTPEWVRDAVFYQIFPDRFARSAGVPKPRHLDEWGSVPTSHGYQGGDLLGVVEHLDYLQDLGATAIYFTPIFQSASNHRYHTHDYEKVDPMLGGNAALRRLVDAAHARGIRVVLDGVFNHASRGFFQFHDIMENGSDSAYLDWFHVTKFPLNAYHHGEKPNYGAWWNQPALPKFHTGSPEVREFLWGIGRKWIDFGVDGWRLDVPHEIDDDSFWREFRLRVKDGNPDAYIVGEVWGDAPRWLQGDMWDAIMNYQFTRACIAFFIGSEFDEDELRRTVLFPAGEPGAPAFRKAIERLLGLYSAPVRSVMLNLLSSHDVARFLTLARGDSSALRLATTFQMTYPGAPSIYYGDEIGMQGGHDPANRGAFPWHRSDTWDNDLLDEFRRLTKLRHASAALRRGSFQILAAREDLFAHARQLGQETVIVVLNTARRRGRLTLKLSGLLADGTILEEAWGRQTFQVDRGALRLGLAPRSSLILATPRRPSAQGGESSRQP